jgi:hypothetical protein
MLLLLEKEEEEHGREFVYLLWKQVKSSQPRNAPSSTPSMQPSSLTSTVPSDFTISFTTV